MNYSFNITPEPYAPINTVDIYQHICTQYNNYFVNLGIGIIILNILTHWFTWWFFNHGYKKTDIMKDTSLNNRVYWDIFIKARLNKLMMGFITVMVWLQYAK